MDKRISRHHRSYTDTTTHFKGKNINISPKYTHTLKTFRSLTVTTQN
jgi:hypothetical protein